MTLVAEPDLSEVQRRAEDLAFYMANHTKAFEAQRLPGADLMRGAGMVPDAWQAEFLEAKPKRALLCCSRQAGKSLVTAAAAFEQALDKERSTTLLISPSQRQSAELLSAVRMLALAQEPAVEMEQSSVLSLRLPTGSRIISLPGQPERIRGYRADLLVVDEAAWVSSALYYSVRPMLAVSGGRLIALSTPYGRRGWFYEEWTSTESWHRTRVTADQVPRISAEFLEEEKRRLPHNAFLSEYMCEFTDREDAVFSLADVEAAMVDDVDPLFALDERDEVEALFS